MYSTILMKLFDLLFGKKRTIKHTVLGTLTSQRIRGNNQTKTCTWSGSITLNNQEKETFVMLEGHLLGPSASHLESINDLVENWDTKYISQIREKIEGQKINQDPKFSNWQKDFYVGAIWPIDRKKPEFELTFEPLDKNETDFISVIIKNNGIGNVEIYK